VRKKAEHEKYNYAIRFMVNKDTKTKFDRLTKYGAINVSEFMRRLLDDYLEKNNHNHSLNSPYRFKGCIKV